jgi:hypothetical protein
MHNDIVYIGNKSLWGGEQPFGLRCADRRQHVYTIGKTGAGKTTMLRNLILQDIEAGRGVGLIDPHGDFAEEVLDHIPPWRTDHVVYFNPADVKHPIGFNFLEPVPAGRRHLIASGVVSAFKNIWSESWGPRLEYILYATVAALLDCENVSLLGVQRMLVDGRYRAWVIKQIKNPIVRSFWTDEFENYDARFRAEVLSPVQNKVGQLLMSPPITNILGQVRSTIDPRFIMDQERIFIANLSKGLLGEDKSNLLGAMLVAKFQLAAMERADVPESERRDFFLFVDEFQNFASNSFAAVLSEARKYRLCLTLSHQYSEQLRPEVRDAVFGNVGSIIAFRVGESDASLLEREFGGAYSQAEFTGLSNHEITAKILENGEYHTPFRGRTFPPSGRCYGKRENIIRRSRERHTIKREIVEGKIQRWINQSSR